LRHFRSAFVDNFNVFAMALASISLFLTSLFLDLGSHRSCRRENGDGRVWHKAGLTIAINLPTDDHYRKVYSNMSQKVSRGASELRRKVRLLDGLSDQEQAAIAREYERKTGRAFRCSQCLETGRRESRRSEAEADQPADEVVAVFEEAGAITPLCQSCYQGIVDSEESIQ
jgi:hypothetical protein